MLQPSVMVSGLCWCGCCGVSVGYGFGGFSWCAFGVVMIISTCMGFVVFFYF